MPTRPIIKHLDVFKEAPSRLVTGLIVPIVHELAFECPEEALDTGVISAVGFAAHAGNEAVRLEDALVARGGILAAAAQVVQEPRRTSPMS